jgi:hypothetical protein
VSRSPGRPNASQARAANHLNFIEERTKRAAVGRDWQVRFSGARGSSHLDAIHAVHFRVRQDQCCRGPGLSQTLSVSITLEPEAARPGLGAHGCYVRDERYGPAPCSGGVRSGSAVPARPAGSHRLAGPVQAPGPLAMQDSHTDASLRAQATVTRRGSHPWRSVERADEWRKGPKGAVIEWGKGAGEV